MQLQKDPVEDFILKLKEEGRIISYRETLNGLSEKLNALKYLLKIVNSCKLRETRK